MNAKLRHVRALIVLALVVGSLAVIGAPAASTAASTSKVLRIDHVADGDTVDLTNGAKVRLVQIDTPEVYFHPECYGRQASALTKRLLRLVDVGAAAPYFYRGRRGRYAAKLTRLALRARRDHLGLWGRCPGTPYNPDAGVSTGPAR